MCPPGGTFGRQYWGSYCPGTNLWYIDYCRIDIGTTVPLSCLQGYPNGPVDSCNFIPGGIYIYRITSCYMYIGGGMYASYDECCSDLDKEIVQYAIAHNATDVLDGVLNEFATARMPITTFTDNYKRYFDLALNGTS